MRTPSIATYSRAGAGPPTGGPPSRQASVTAWSSSSSRRVPIASVTARTVLAEGCTPATSAGASAAWANGSNAPSRPIARRTPALWLARPSPSTASSGHQPQPQSAHQ